MITYNPSDPLSEIIFNHRSVAYEARKLVLPNQAFFLGEWCGLGAGLTALTIDSAGNIVIPRMVYTPTDRHDVTESEGVTVALGYFHLSTMNYVSGESFSIGDELVIEVSSSVGKLAVINSGATNLVVGRVRVPPGVDGTDRLIAEIYPEIYTRVLS